MLLRNRVPASVARRYRELRRRQDESDAAVERMKELERYMLKGSYLRLFTADGQSFDGTIAGFPRNGVLFRVVFHGGSLRPEAVMIDVRITGYEVLVEHVNHRILWDLSWNFELRKKHGAVKSLVPLADMFRGVEPMQKRFYGGDIA